MTHYSAAQIRRLRAGVVLIVGTLSGSGISGCGSSNSSGPSAPGSLSVAIVGAGGVTPSVVVDGPGGYQQIMTATGTLSGLTPGSYGVTARSVAGSGSIVPVVYGATVTGSPVTVSSGATATASVSYAARPGTGVLWVGNAAENGPLLAGYTAAQLTASTSAPPAIVLTASPQSGTSPVTGVAFDKDGNLWVASSLDSTVSEYTAAQLATSGSVTPAVVLSSTPDADYPEVSSLAKPAGMAFDASGNLWVANNDFPPTIVEFTSSQLRASGAPAPALTVRGCGCPSARCFIWCHPGDRAFDASGNLWVTDGPLARVMMLPAIHLGDPNPTVTIGSAPGASALAFDAAGNLWVSCSESEGLGETANQLIEFTPSQLATTGFPVPAVTLSGTGTSLSSPSGLAFDASGDLWVANLGGNAILEFTASQLAASGAPVPSVVVGATWGPPVLAFNPHSPDLPLK